MSTEHVKNQPIHVVWEYKWYDMIREPLLPPTSSWFRISGATISASSSQLLWRSTEESCNNSLQQSGKNISWVKPLYNTITLYPALVIIMLYTVLSLI